MNKLIAATALALSFAIAPATAAIPGGLATANDLAVRLPAEAPLVVKGDPVPGAVEWYLTRRAAVAEGVDPGWEPVPGLD